MNRRSLLKLISAVPFAGILFRAKPKKYTYDSCEGPTIITKGFAEKIAPVKKPAGTWRFVVKKVIDFDGRENITHRTFLISPEGDEIDVVEYLEKNGCMPPRFSEMYMRYRMRQATTR